MWLVNVALKKKKHEVIMFPLHLIECKQHVNKISFGGDEAADIKSIRTSAHTHNTGSK